MLPRNMDPRKLKLMMRQMGINTEDVEDVEEVLIRTRSRNFVFKKPQVTIIEAQGQKTFQVIGEPRVTEGGGGGEGGTEGEEGPAIPEEDIKLVAEKVGVSEQEALKALVECKGEPAEAIIKLMSR